MEHITPKNHNNNIIEIQSSPFQIFSGNEIIWLLIFETREGILLVIGGCVASTLPVNSEAYHLIRMKILPNLTNVLFLFSRLAREQSKIG